MRGNSVYLVVRRHHAACSRFLHRSAKRDKKILANDSFRKVSRGGVGASLRLSMHREVLCRGYGMMTPNEIGVSLQPGYGGYAHPRNEEGIFAIRLFGPAPPGVTSKVENWRKHL